MGDVLSQSQIDALLSAAQAGTLDEEVSEEKKTKKYDFHTPKKFTKDRLRLISGVYENYARLIASHLTSMMRMDIEVELLAVEEQRYYEFNNALMEEDVLAFVDYEFADYDELMDPVLIQMSIPIIHGFVDRMLGGSGDSDPASDSNTITDVEMAVYENLTSKIAPVMNDVWDTYVDVDFKFMRMEVNPRLVQAMGMEEIVVIVALSVRINEIYGQMNVCLPSEMLDFIFKKIEENASLLNRRKENQTEDEKESIMAQIEESNLPIVARLSPQSILLDDLFRMRPGDIVNLAIPVDSECLIDVGGQQWFLGKMGTFRGNKAVVIDAVVDHEEIADR